MPEREVRGIEDGHKVTAVDDWLHGHKMGLIGQTGRIRLIYHEIIGHQSQNAMFLSRFAILRFGYYAILFIDLKKYV